MTSDELIISIRNLGCVPDTASPGAADIDLLLHADEALRNYLLPRLLNLRESYYVLRERRPVVSTQSWYRLPTRAAFDRLKGLWNVQGTDRSKIGPAKDDDAGSGYVLEGNGVRILPEPSHGYSGSLEFAFYQRPGSLVLTEDARQVLTVDPVTRIVTFATAVPATWTSALKYDVHSEHSGAELKLWDQLATVPVGSSMTFTSAIDGSTFGSKPVEVGDWIVVAGKSAAPALPTELHGALSRQVAMHFAEASGDVQMVQTHAQVIEKYLKEVTAAMETRVESEPIRLGGGGAGFLCRL